VLERDHPEVPVLEPFYLEPYESSPFSWGEASSSSARAHLDAAVLVPSRGLPRIAPERYRCSLQAGWPRALRRPRKVRTPQGRTLGKSQAAKADGKWNREETAGSRTGKGETVG